MIGFPFVIQEELITSSILQISWVVILVQLFAKFTMGDILDDTAIITNLSKKEPLCKSTQAAAAAGKKRLCLSGESVNMQQFLKDSLEL